MQRQRPAVGLNACCVMFFRRRPFVAKKLYVGNLSYDVTDSDLENLFSPHGTVQSAQVIMDRDAGRSKGFGFVEMNSDQEAQAAITALNGTESNGRSLTVNEARPREERGGSRGNSERACGPPDRRKNQPMNHYQTLFLTALTAQPAGTVAPS